MQKTELKILTDEKKNSSNATNNEEKDIIEQMKNMEIMRHEDDVRTTTPMTPDSEIVSSRDIDDDISDDGDQVVTDPNEELETTTVIATSISTSEAFSYFSSASISNNES